MSDFADSDFIPDQKLCEEIDESSPLIILKYNFDGRICDCFLKKKDVNYLELLKQTDNTFLKLAFFECVKLNISKSEQSKILNTEKLVPLYLEVAVNIVNHKNLRYRPLHLIKEYINLSHPILSNKEMFENVGKILTLIIEKKTHINDLKFILTDFLGLKKKILKENFIPNKIFIAIEYWLNNIFSGNITYYDLNKKLLLGIIELFELKKPEEVNQTKEILYNKYKEFYDENLPDNDIDLNNIQSIEPNKRFTSLMLEITQKYCINEDKKEELEKALKLKYEKLHKSAIKAMESLPPLIFNNKIPVELLEKEIEPFKNDTLEEFLIKVVLEDYFIPEIPKIPEDQGISRYIPTKVYDNTTRVFEAGKPVLIKTSSYKKEVIDTLNIFDFKLKEYHRFDLIGNIYAHIHLSKLIDDVSKKIFEISLIYYVRGDYLSFIQGSVLQIERILRILCEKKSIVNLYKDEKKENPKGLEYMIGELKKQGEVSGKFLFFIEWLLINSSEIISENIRNKIAHGIDDWNQLREIFTKYNALAILLIYLFLSKL